MKTKKRKLEGQELIFAMKGLENRKQEKEWLEYQIEYHDLMLKTGLDMNHKKNIRDFKQNKKEYESELAIVKNVINILQSQIRDGVEEKVEQVKEVEKEDK